MDKKPEECKAGAPEWMVTYGDLVTLLMCFFVLLFAFSEIDAQKFEQVMQSFQGSAGVLEGGKSLSEDALIFDASPEQDTSPQTTDQERLEVIEEMLAQAAAEIASEIAEALAGGQSEELIENISIEIMDNKIIIRLNDNVLFDSAKAEVKTEALPILTALGEVLQGEMFTESEIKIEGHTDNLPINTLRFPSNWELSAARATSVLTYFVDSLEFDPARLSIAGHGEYKPIDTNDTPEGRSANRRVEITIEKLNLVPESEVPTE